MLRLQIASSLMLALILLALCYNIQTAPTHHLTIGVQGNTPTLMVTSSEIGITAETMGSMKKPDYNEKSHKHLDAKKKWDDMKLTKNHAAFNKKDKLQHSTKLLTKQTSLKEEADIQPNLKTTPATLKSLLKDQIISKTKMQDFKTKTPTTTSKPSLLENSENFTTNKQLTTLDFKEINEKPSLTTQIAAHETTTPQDSLDLKTMTTTLKPKYVNIPSTMSANLNPKDLNDISTTTTLNYPDEENPQTPAISNDFTQTQIDTKVNKKDDNNVVVLNADVSQTQILQETTATVIKTKNENDNDSYTPDPVAATTNNENLLLTSVETKVFTNTPIASTTVDISTDSTPSLSPNTFKEDNAQAAQRQQILSLSSLTITSKMGMETPMTTTEKNVGDNDKTNNMNQQKSSTEFAEIDKTTESFERNINKESEQKDSTGMLANHFVTLNSNTEYTTETIVMPQIYVTDKTNENLSMDINKATITQEPQSNAKSSETEENKTKSLKKQEIEVKRDSQDKQSFVSTKSEHDYYATTTAKALEDILVLDGTTMSGGIQFKVEEVSNEPESYATTNAPETTHESQTTTTEPHLISQKTTSIQSDETFLEPKTTTEAVLKLIDLEQHVLKTIHDLKQPSLLMSGQHDNGHDGLKNIKKKQLVDKHYVEALLHNKQDVHVGDTIENEQHLQLTTQRMETTSDAPAATAPTTTSTTNKPILMPVKHGYLGPILMEEKTFHVIHHSDNGETNKKHHVADIENELRKHHFVELKVKTEDTGSAFKDFNRLKDKSEQLRKDIDDKRKDNSMLLKPDELEMQSDQPASEIEKSLEVKEKYSKLEHFKQNAKFQSKLLNKEAKNLKAVKNTLNLSSGKTLETQTFTTTKEIIEPTEHSPIDLNDDLKAPTEISKSEEVTIKSFQNFNAPHMALTTTTEANQEIGQTIGTKEDTKSSVKISNSEEVSEISSTETITQKFQEFKEIKFLRKDFENNTKTRDFKENSNSKISLKEDLPSTTDIAQLKTTPKEQIEKSIDIKEDSKTSLEKSMSDEISSNIFSTLTTIADTLPNTSKTLNESKIPASNANIHQQNDKENKSSIVLSTTVFQVMESVATKTPIMQADTLFTSDDKENPVSAVSNTKEQTESKISDIQIEVYDSTIDSIVASTNFKDGENKKRNMDESSLGKTTKPPVAAIQQERFTQYVIDRAETSTHEPINYSTIQVASGKPEPAAIEIHINVSESFGNESEDLEFAYPQSEYNNNNNERIGELLYEDTKVNDNIKLKIPSNSNNNGKDMRNDEILVVEIIDTDNITDDTFKEKHKATDDLFITDSKNHVATPPPPPPPPPYQTNFDRDSDTIFYISNTEVKVGESLPNSQNDNEERKLKLESQFFPANYIASTHPNINNREDSNTNHHVYEEDIILSSSRNQADSLKIYRNRNEPSPPLDVTYVGESIIEVEQSPDTVLTTTYAPDQSHNSGTPQADVIIQPAILPEISIGVPVIGELPPQIELKEIDFMPNEAQLHRSGIYDDNDIDDNTINGGSNSNHEADIANNNINQRVDESSIQYGGDLIDESADGGFDGVEGSYPFGNPAAIGKSSSSPYTSAFMAKLRKQQQQPNHVADYAHLYVNYGVNNMRKDELSADVKDSGETMLVGSSDGRSGNSNNIASNEQNITNFKDFLLNNNNNKVSLNNSNLLTFMSANLTQNERMSNATAFSVMEDANDLEDKNAEDIINLISLAIGLFIVILPVVVTCSLFWALRYLYIKYHSNLTDNGGYAEQTEIKVPLDEDGVEKGEDISRVARETKMDYNKDGVFVVEVARGIDSKTIPESPVTEGSEKMLSMFDTKQNNGGIGYKISNEKNCINNEKVQIHSPPPENPEEGPRSLHQIEEEPTNSPQLNDNSNDGEVIGLAYKANTGLSQSDLSTTSSNDSNKAYCYGNQELYVVEQSGYGSASPVSNVVLKCDVKDIKDDDRNPGNDHYLKHTPDTREESKEKDDMVETARDTDQGGNRTNSGESPASKQTEKEQVSKSETITTDETTDNLSQKQIDVKESNINLKSDIKAPELPSNCNIPVEIEVHITPAQLESSKVADKVEETSTEVKASETTCAQTESSKIANNVEVTPKKLKTSLPILEATESVTEPLVLETISAEMEDDLAAETFPEIDIPLSLDNESLAIEETEKDENNDKGEEVSNLTVKDAELSQDNIKIEQNTNIEENLVNQNEFELDSNNVSRELDSTHKEKLDENIEESLKKHTEQHSEYVSQDNLEINQKSLSEIEAISETKVNEITTEFERKEEADTNKDSTNTTKQEEAQKQPEANSLSQSKEEENINNESLTETEMDNKQESITNKDTKEVSETNETEPEQDQENGLDLNGVGIVHMNGVAEEDVLRHTDSPTEAVEDEQHNSETLNGFINSDVESLTNGSTTLPDLVTELKSPHLQNGHAEVEPISSSLTDMENGYDSIMSLPEPPPTTDETLISDISEQQLDSLPPPPPPEIFNLKDLPPPLTNGNAVDSPQSEESNNFYNTLPPPPPTTLEVNATETTTAASATTNGKVHASPLTPPASPPAHYTNNLHAGLCSQPIAVDVNGS